jgi:IS5 family transposase
MAQQTLTSLLDVRNRILAMPDTEMKKIMLEILRVLETHPNIISCAQADLDRAALACKRDRIVEAVDRFSDHPVLPGIEAMTVEEAQALDIDTLSLSTGRPRLLDGEAVCVLAMCRAHLDSVTSKSARDRMLDSQLLAAYFEARGIPMPGRSAMHEWINCLTHNTYECILDAHLAMVLDDGLESFHSVTADSFSVWADTAWPTDSAMIYGLLARAWNTAGKLRNAGLPSFSEGWISLWLDRIRELDRDISFACGKPGSKRKIRRMYIRIFNYAEKAMTRLERQFEKLLPEWDEAMSQLPIRLKKRLNERIDSMFNDLASAARVVVYSRDRVEHGQGTAMSNKVLSLSDGSAAYIKKGGRQPVIGYKPQVMRSRKGFITAFEVQHGNPSDSARMVPLTEQHIQRTGVTPEKLSVDDGYSSGPNRQQLLELGIKTVSMNGAKGKKITSEEEWNSAEYETARNERSAVESLVYTVRYKFHLYRFSRRGLENVTTEMYEKVIAHNLWRSALLREQAASQQQVASLPNAA